MQLSRVPWLTLLMVCAVVPETLRAEEPSIPPAASETTPPVQPGSAPEWHPANSPADTVAPAKNTALRPLTQWTIQVDPLTVALGLVHVQVERRLSPDWSLYLGPNLRLFDGLLEETPQPYRGLGVEVGLRRFFAGHAPTGGWVMARGVVAHLSTTDGTDASSVGWYGSLLAGYTTILGGHFVLSGGLGVQYMAYHLGEYGFGGFLPAAHTAVGVAF